MDKNNTKDKYQEIFNILSEIIVEPKSELNYSNAFELLIAVMLSAQCTDKRVNMVTDKLFKLYSTPEDFAMLTVEELEKHISSCNFYHNKAKNIISMSQSLLDRFQGRVPSNHEDLVSLAGVGNKTANVVLAVGFGIPAFAVDTHVFRVCNRVGLAEGSTPLEIEKKMTKKYPREQWLDLHHLILLFGRYHCKAIGPKCEGCRLYDYCKYVKTKEGK